MAWHKIRWAFYVGRMRDREWRRNELYFKWFFCAVHYWRPRKSRRRKRSWRKKSLMWFWQWMLSCVYNKQTGEKTSYVIHVSSSSSSPSCNWRMRCVANCRIHFIQIISFFAQLIVEIGNNWCPFNNKKFAFSVKRSLLHTLQRERGKKHNNACFGLRTQPSPAGGEINAWTRIVCIITVDF